MHFQLGYDVFNEVVDSGVRRYICRFVYYDEAVSEGIDGRRIRYQLTTCYDNWGFISIRFTVNSDHPIVIVNSSKAPRIEMDAEI